MFKIIKSFYIILGIINIGYSLEVLCEQIIDQEKCNSQDICEYTYWLPPLCQYICSAFTKENDCNQAINCTWEKSCQIRKCNAAQTQAECDLIVACIWQNKQCWDSSCVTLEATDSGKCPTSYCLWSSKRHLCYDKKCSDYASKYDCGQISFCIWDKYKCLLNEKSTSTSTSTK